MSDDGSEDLPVRPKRKIKKVLLLHSTSESDSDTSVGVVETRRKRLRVISDDESSSSSGSSVVLGGMRRRRTLPKLRDSEHDSDTSGWATDHSDTPKAAPVAAKPKSGFASDSSEGNSDKCSICLLRFTNQEIGTPQSCEHIFCLDCITEWSKNVNTCPVDRSNFDFIVVRACVGGRVLRTEHVRVVQRSPSVDIVMLEDTTRCEVCGSVNNEETMLLCDGCDLGYHMQCLTPPLTQVPMEQWLCPNCYEYVVHESPDDILYSLINTEFMGVPPTTSQRRETRNSRMARNRFASDATTSEPSTSSRQRNNNFNAEEMPTTSYGSTSSRTTSNTRSRRTTGTRKKRKTRRTRTVIVEYEVKENGKFPVTKRVKRRVKKRRIKKRPTRTAARRSHVRASVRAKLATLNSNQQVELAQLPTAGSQNLSVQRHRAGITSLSIFGNPNQLEYFSDNDDVDVSEGATTVVAVRPTSNILSAYRQARRKMVSIPSPQHATSAPDILSNIMESQTLLHSKNTVVSISVDGNVDIKLQGNKRRSLPKDDIASKKDEKLDLSNGEDATKKAPSYPGQSRGGGGWSGGYRGNYHREQNSNNFNNRGNNFDNNYGGGYQNRQGNINFQNNNMRRDENDTFSNYGRRYSHNDDSYFDRSRRPGGDSNRSLNFPPQHHHRLSDQGPGRYSVGQSWQPFSGGAPGPRPETQHLQAKHSFGGYENPLDMRVGQAPPPISVRNDNNIFSPIETSIQVEPQPQSYQPLPEPPVFNFGMLRDVEKSEDEKSDSGLVIDTEKYDPTEPTNDDDSGEEDKIDSIAPQNETSPPPTPSAVQNILAGIDSSAINVPHNILDSAVRQVLKEHRNLIVPPSVQSSHNDKSDEDSDGDCPNFSIYSATSVHIANNTSNLTTEVQKEQPQDNLEDLVQEDDDIPPSPEGVSPNEVSTSESALAKVTIDTNKIVSKPTTYSNNDSIIMKKKTEEEYKEKISKRCPITTNTRNPIKIKLHTPSLIKRQVTLYDDEDTNDEIESSDKPEQSAEICEAKNKSQEQSPKIIPDSKQNEDKNEINIFSDKEKESETNMQTTALELQQPNDDRIQEIKSSQESDENNQDQEDNLSKVESVPDSNDTMKDPIEDVIECEKRDDAARTSDNEKSEYDANSEDENVSDDDLPIHSHSPKKDSSDRNDETVEKMTESISETEDERSYTPCLDENKSKDTSLETEKEKGIEGLDTEMISEDEENEMFSENDKAPEPTQISPVRVPLAVENEEGEILDKRKESKDGEREEVKKKKKRDSKKDGKDKSKSKGKKGDISFKKLSKSGKERNYRERDKDAKGKKKDRRDSSETAEEKQKRRKEKRKDLERYDVRTVVTEKRKKMKDPFGRDISPLMRSPSLSRLDNESPTRMRRSPSHNQRSISRDRKSPSRNRRSLSRGRKSISRARRSISRGRRSLSRGRRSMSRIRKSISRGRRSHSRGRKSLSRGRPSPSRRISPSRIRMSPRGRKSPSRGRGSPHRGRRSVSSPAPIRRRASVTPRSLTPRPAMRPSLSPKRRSPSRKRRRSVSPRRRLSLRRRRSNSRRKQRRSASRSPKPKTGKKKKRFRSERPRSPRQKSPKRKKTKPLTASPEPEILRPAWSPASVDSRLLSPRTPPPDLSPELSPDPRHLHVVLAPDKRKRKEKRRDPDRQRHKRRDAGPSKEVFTSGDNILVSVSFKDQERRDEGDKRKRKETKREKRKRKRAPPETETVKPVAIIDLERSPFRELTPSPKDVIVLSDSDHAEKESERPAAQPQPEPPQEFPAVGPKTPPEPEAPPVEETEEARGPNTPPEPPDSPDAYDPFEPTRSPSPSPDAQPSPPRTTMTLETAQRTNMSADEVIDRRPLSPMEKVMALLQSTRDVSPEPPPGPTSAPEPTPGPPAAAPRIVLPSPTRTAPPKLFLAKPSPIKSNPVKPMPKVARPAGAEDSPYSPGSSDFGDLFEPPAGLVKPPSTKRDTFDSLFDKPPKTRKNKSSAAKVPVRLNKKKGKTQVGVKIDEDNLKILDDLPSSAVEMQVKSKFLKKLNRQERVVEEVKLVLKPHYNKKHVTKEEYKDILRRAVPKICHNKSGEINPTKIQALVEAYVRKFRKKHKLGVA